MEETSEYSTSEMPEIPIPAVDVEMVVDQNPIVFNEPSPSIMETYKQEMLQRGFHESDLEYFSRAYKNLSEVKYIKIHCTSCDKHLGSAPNQKAQRYEHPLLKVVICEMCYVFYSSGDFEKDEDGSEMYCRWCGEGGEVYCCTKCPYVFCKKCIRRNLGRGIVRYIQNSDNWVCFACNPSLINRHRATYWAIQKWSEEMVKNAVDSDSNKEVSTDCNICCAPAKRRAEIYGKLKTPPTKKSKLTIVKNNLLSSKPAVCETKPSTSNATKNFTWQSASIEADQDEVICTPDIMPIDDSPPSSPKPEPGPSIPVPIQPKVQILTSSQVATLPPPLRPPPIQTSIQMAEIQKQLQTAFPQKIFITQASSMSPRMLNSNPVIIKPGSANSAPGNIVTLNDKYKVLISKPLPKPVQNVNRNYLLTPVTTGNSSINNTTIVRSPLVKNPKPPVQVPNQQNKTFDWFDQAVLHCAEVTEYITTKISSLSGVHTRAHKSEKLMEELHNTLQTYLYAAMEKLNKVKKSMKDNFDNEQENKLTKPHVENTKVQSSDESEESEGSSISYRHKNRKRRKSKSSKCAIEAVKPEDVPFDMTVTNASDEEQSLNGGGSQPDSFSDVEMVCEIKTKGVENEIISLLETSDEENDEEADGNEELNKSELISSNPIINGLMKQLKSKINVNFMQGQELLKHLSAIVVVEQSIEVQHRLKNNESNSSEKAMAEQNSDKCCTKSSDENVEAMYVDNNYKDNVITTHKEDAISEDIQEKKSDNPEETVGKELPNNVEDQEFNEKEFDVEELLSSTMVIKSNNNTSKSFVDVFSKFLNAKDVNKSHPESDASVSRNKTVDVIKDFDIISSDSNYEADASLSVPPADLKQFMSTLKTNSKMENKNYTTSNVLKHSETKSVEENDKDNSVKNKSVKEKNNKIKENKIIRTFDIKDGHKSKVKDKQDSDEEIKSVTLGMKTEIM